MDDRWFSMKEICTYLGVSHNMIFRWIANCDMSLMKMGKCWKLKKGPVGDRFVKEGPEKSRKMIGNDREDIGCPSDEPILRADKNS